MHCENCENKIKGNLRFEKGIKEIVTHIDAQTVTIKYDADKTSEETVEGFREIRLQGSCIESRRSGTEE